MKNSSILSGMKKRTIRKWQSNQKHREQELQQTIIKIEKENEYLREEREHNLWLLRDKELKMNELKHELEQKEVMIYRLKKKLAERRSRDSK